MCPRQRVPQRLWIQQRGALLIALNIRALALLPGDRLFIKDAVNDTMLVVSSANQSVVLRALRRQRRMLWNHPLLAYGNRVTIEYWPSLRTLVLPINRPQLDNPVLVLDSFTFAFFPRKTTLRSDDDEANDEGDDDGTNSLESTVGATNEMKPAVCYKGTERTWYNTSRSVARLIIQRSANASANMPPRYAIAPGAVGAEDPRDLQTSSDAPPTRGVSYTFCTGWLVGRGNHMLTNYHCFYELTRRYRSGFPAVQATNVRLRNLTSRNSSSVPTTTSPPPCASDSSGNGSAADSTPTRTGQWKQVGVNFMAEAKTCNTTTAIRRIGERAGAIDATSVEILVASEALDYCLLKVRPSRNGSSDDDDVDLSKTFGYLTMRASGPSDGEAVYIPQHPNGEPKTIAATKDGKPAVVRLSNRTRRRADQNDLLRDDAYISVRYNADTAPGSSGSPVISQRDNTVVALHHAGTGVRPRHADSASSPGWMSSLVDLVRGSDSSDDSGIATAEGEYNVGVRIDAIVADLRKRRLLPPCAIAGKCPAGD